MMLRRIESLDEYRALLDGDPAELAALYQDFLIRVTEFFRDPDSFEALRQEVFPALPRGPDPETADQDLGARLRDRRRGLFASPSRFSNTSAIASAAAEVQIFGTDVSEAALEKARAGVYLTNVLQDVSS